MRGVRRWLSAALCAVLLLGLLIPASGASDGVYLMAVNDRVLVDTTVDNMPRVAGGVLYVPYTMLSNQVQGINLGVNALYSATKRTVLVVGGSKGVEFNTQTNTAQDLNGNAVPVRAMVRNAMVFLPIDWLCEYFGSIRCTRTQSAYGTVVRLTNASAVLEDREFVNAAAPQLASALECYLASGGKGEDAGPAPTGSVEATAPPSGAELFLACRWGVEAEDCAHLLENQGRRGLFLLTPEEIAVQDDLVRRLVGAGHTVGLVLEGGSAERCLAQGAEGRRLLAAAARYNALVASAPGLDDEGREALEAAGYVVWTATAQGEDFSTGTALVRGLSTRRVNFVEVACGSGGAAFLRGALNAMEEENCQIDPATAPGLAW